MEILNIKNLSFTYASADRPSLCNIDLSVNEGEFVLVCGATGSGKSTLLRLIKEELRPKGIMEGSIWVGNSINSTDPPESSDSRAGHKPRIGFVMQDPKQQIVTDRVWHELAFGMENLGMPQSHMAVRSAEMAAYFGIEEWYLKNVNELSGGQMQLVNLASVLVTDPDILILDEPAAMLDPVSAADFYSTLRRLSSGHCSRLS